MNQKPPTDADKARAAEFQRLYLTSIKNQRNGAFDEAAQLGAALELATKLVQLAQSQNEQLLKEKGELEQRLALALAPPPSKPALVKG